MTASRGELLFAALHVVPIATLCGSTREMAQLWGHTRSFRLSVSANALEGDPSPLRNLFCWRTPRTRWDARRDGCDPLNHRSGVWQAVLPYGRTVWNVECARRDVLSTVHADLVPWSTAETNKQPNLRPNACLFALGPWIQLNRAPRLCREASVSVSRALFVWSTGALRSV